MERYVEVEGRSEVDETIVENRLSVDVHVRTKKGERALPRFERSGIDMSR